MRRVVATVERRLLVNFRVDPALMRRILPDPFEPQVVNGASIVGMCLIRLRSLRPARFPVPTGLRSEHLAHRIAVEVGGDGARRVGVYVRRRETSSRTALLGSRLFFSGGLHAARFDVSEHDGAYRIAVASRDGAVRVRVDGHVDAAMPAGSVFASRDDASRFFSAGCDGFSDGAEPGVYDGVRLSMRSWALQPVRLGERSSSVLDDPSLFPAGALEFDSAFLMTDLDSTWETVVPVVQRDRVCVGEGLLRRRAF